MFYEISGNQPINEQKQSSGGVYKKGVLWKFCKILNSTKSCKPPAWRFIKKRLRHRCFPMIFAKFLRVSFWQNYPGRLLLNVMPLLRNCLVFPTKLLNANIVSTWFLPGLSFCDNSILMLKRVLWKYQRWPSKVKACVRYFHHIFIFSPNDSPSKTMENAFYFI